MNTLASAAQQTSPAPNVSFEFFPPKTDKMEAKLWESVARLSPMAPKFVSVTYGAGGSTRDRTQQTVAKIAQDTPLAPAAHLTCVSATKEEVLQVATDFWNAGVRHLVALRGDPPEGMGAKFEQHPGGFRDSVELIQGIRDYDIAPGARFEISVSCYPEQHPDSLGWDEDIAFLKAKQDAGADRAITQFFFEPDVYLGFLERARAGGVTMPIVLGVSKPSGRQGAASPIPRTTNGSGNLRTRSFTKKPPIKSAPLTPQRKTWKAIAPWIASSAAMSALVKRKWRFVLPLWRRWRDNRWR